MTNLVSMSVEFDGTALEIIDHAGTPWLTLSQIAIALGYENASSLVDIHRRNRSEFTPDMTALLRQGRTRIRIFSARGAHLIGMFARTPKAKAFRRWVLDVLDGLDRPVKPVSETPQVQALPAPAPKPVDPITPEVRRAIERKAHALSLEAFEHNRAYLEAWIRRLPETRDPLAALEHVHALDVDHGQHVIVNFQDLWRVTAWAGELGRLARNMQAEVDALEQATGRKLCVR